MDAILPIPAGYDFCSRKVKLSTGISMHFIEKKPIQSECKGVVLCVHGWPDCWYGFRRNIDAICGAGYHVVVPDQRGYGQTSKPAEVSKYEIQVLVNDNIALLDFLRVEKAVLIGHDWGGTLVWNFAMHFPERVAAVASFCTPFFPPNPQKNPWQSMKNKPGGRFDYQLWFQETEAEVELEEDTRRTIKLIHRAISDDMGKFVGGDPEIFLLPPTQKRGFLAGLGKSDEISRSVILTAEDLEYYGQNFDLSGFRGPLNWYRNVEANWKWNCTVAGKKLSANIPALMVASSDDVVLTPSMVESLRMSDWIPNLEIKYIQDAGHWVLQEKPEEVNLILEEWLKTLKFDPCSKL